MRMRACLPIILLVAGCVSKPAPKPAPPIAPPVQRPAPAPATFAKDWIDWPITPGDWRYVPTAGGSLATFGTAGSDADFTLRCDRQARAMLISRSGAFPEGASGRLTIRTTSVAKTLEASNAGGAPPYVTSRVPATDTHLDAVAFSRGRFLVQVKGASDLVIPAWPEIARVIEDCRAA